MDWIDLARDMDTWRYIVHTVINLLVPQNARNFLTSRYLVSFSRIMIQAVSYLLNHLFRKVGLPCDNFCPSHISSLC